jgi:P27 family predicted phage terminase small subunit
MGLRGPKAKPDWLKVLDGNPGRRPINEAALQKASGGAREIALDPPAWFDAEQREVWEKVCEVLGRVDALSVTDQFPLSRYVELLTMYRRASLGMQSANGQVVYPIRDKNGTVKSIRTLPQLKAMLEISNHLLRIEQYFGMTPTSRAGFMPNGDTGTLGIDPFAVD